MKKLLLLWLFSGSPDGFSQSAPDTLIQAPDGTCSVKRAISKPDTIRATLIVYYDKGPAFVHTKPGYVVYQYAKDCIYLDDRYRVIKPPLEVLTYKLRRAKQ